MRIFSSHSNLLTSPSTNITFASVNGAQRPTHFSRRASIDKQLQTQRKWSSGRHRVTGSSAPTDVIVLDFDGVLVDSEPEVTASALVAAEERWPELFSGISKEQEMAIIKHMRKVRPVLVRGFESMIMARMLREDLDHADQILADWARLLPAQLQKYKEDENELIKLFERVRNAWMNERTESWMQQQQPFPGVVAALQECPYPVYFASSKAAHRVSALMAAVMGLDVPVDSPRLFASLLPPEEAKAEALRKIMARPVCSGPSTVLHFVDDRLDTLLAAQQYADLASRWRLYLASWGYCTAEEIAKARATPGVTVLELSGFLELLRFGLVMEVHDGCEPTAAEVQQGVS